jgi:hypothetical protein
VGSKKIRIGFWGWYFIGIVVILVIVTVFQKDSFHYVGKTVITLEQYEEITANIELNKKSNYITPTAEGDLLTYDFYSTVDQFEFLVLKPYTFTDSAVFTVVKEVGLNSPIPYLIGAYIFTWYLVNYKRGWVYKIETKIKHYFEKQADKKIPLMVNHRLVTAPTGIGIDGEKGIIVLRSWGVDNKGILKSLIQNIKWDGKVLTADKNPNKDNPKGIYGYRLGVGIKQQGKVMGIVALEGEYSYHSEGIVRAEHCKILGFLMSKGFERTARFISNKYNVPTYLDESAEVAYYNWLFSEGGQKALQHNYELLK